MLHVSATIRCFFEICACDTKQRFFPPQSADSTTQKPPGGDNGGGGFVFGSSTGMSFASLAQVNQNVEFNFATTADAAAPWTGTVAE